MSARIIDRLTPRPGECALDLGCGTGLYSRCLVDRAGYTFCADPSRKMLDQLSADASLFKVQATAEEITDGAVTLGREHFDAILAKEMLHHVPRPNRSEVLEGVARLLSPHGRLLIILMPPTIDHPLFVAALRRYEHHPIDPAEAAAVLAEIGLKTEVTVETFRVAVEKQRWLTMIRDRYMSLLSKFDDQELAAGVVEVDAGHPERVLEFDDRFIFILARR
ncbi:hypothetical protein GCM10023196_088520 [Actinoallomurus vinaceus]|uniref:Methyltransferase type 11 domain-containing protein n=1 Tax=Actinoallomurus vinaceus TaxID=1080074 RepID=A0ABP8UQA1_9ACTN